MNFKETITECRRKTGFIKPNDRSDIEWMCNKIINENREVFDALGKS